MVGENTNIVMRCRRCNKQVVLSDMKLAADGKTLVCKECTGLSVKDHLAQLKEKAKAGRVVGRPASGKVKYVCDSCGFKFSRADIKPKSCPYCGKSAVVEASTISAESLLDED